MSVRYICVLDDRLFHEALTDGDVAVFKIVVLGEEPQIPHSRLLDAAVHGENKLNISCIIEDVGGSTSKKEHMGYLGVYFWDNVVIC